MTYSRGPWTYEPATEMECATVANADRIIARVHREGAPPTKETIARVNANALLIAAAPDLLAACEQAQEVLSAWDRSTVAAQALDAVSAAIAKAKGGAA